MKKLFCGLGIALGLAIAVVAPASACIGPDGKPVEGVDGEATNCLETTGASEVSDHFTIDEVSLDYGQVTELGRSYTKQVVISNNTDNDVIIDATVEKYAEASAKNQELADWLAFVGGVSHFTVLKGATYNLSVRAVVPEDALAGSQYAIVKLTDGNGFSLESLARMTIASEKLQYNSEVSGAWIDPVHIDDKLAASVTVKNTGDTGFNSTYQVKAKSFFGGDWKVVQEIEDEVLPGKELTFKDNSVLGFGVYNVEQRVTFVNNEGRMVESLLTRTVVNLPWWSLAIAGGVILLIIIIVVICKKKGKKNREDDDGPEELEAAPKVSEDVVEEIEEKTEEPTEEPEPVKEEPVQKSAPVKVAVVAKKPVVKKPVAKPNPKRIKIQ
ncbi:hypothetical protein J6X13_01190 [Candidatus Saccharibacteria bacterium]|nr:hypothetical protein [Candidatus Saccharibacteria bacterium]